MGGAFWAPGRKIAAADRIIYLILLRYISTLPWL